MERLFRAKEPFALKTVKSAEEEVKIPGSSMEGQCHLWCTESSVLRNEPALAGCKG